MAADDGAEPDRTRARRGSAGQRLRDAAEELFASVTLDDLTSFVTVGRLTEASGLSNGAVYSAYGSAEDAEGRSRSAPQAVMRDVFVSIGPDDDEMVVEIIEMIHERLESAEAEGHFIATIADLATAPIVESARTRLPWDYTHLWLGAAVAKNDPEVAASLRNLYITNTASYERVLGRLLELSGRELVDDVDLGTFAQMLVAGADGAALRLRIDPDADGSVVRLLFLATFIAMTRRVDEDVLLSGRMRIRSGPDPASVDEVAVADVVRRLADRGGWPAVTLRRVSELADLPERSLVERYPSRHHFAAVVWSDGTEAAIRRAAARAGEPAVGEPAFDEAAVGELVRDIADAACARRSVVASLLTARLEDAGGRAGADDATDPLVAALALALGGGPRARDAAQVAVDAMLVGAASSDAAPDALATMVVAGLRAITAVGDDTT